MNDKQFIRMFIVVGCLIAFFNPVLGALVMVPAFVVIVARRLTK